MSETMTFPVVERSRNHRFRHGGFDYAQPPRLRYGGFDYAQPPRIKKSLQVQFKAALRVCILHLKLIFIFMSLCNRWLSEVETTMLNWMNSCYRWLSGTETTDYVMVVSTTLNHRVLKKSKNSI